MCPKCIGSVRPEHVSARFCIGRGSVHFGTLRHVSVTRVERLENESKSSSAAHAKVPAELVENSGEDVALTCGMVWDRAAPA